MKCRWARRSKRRRTVEMKSSTLVIALILFSQQMWGQDSTKATASSLPDSSHKIEKAEHRDTSKSNIIIRERDSTADKEPDDFEPLDTPPIAIDQVDPIFPNNHPNINGSVWVKCFVEKDGTVKMASITHSEVPVMDTACIAAVLKWKFTPAMKKGEPIGVWVTIPFNLKVKHTYHN